MNDIKTNEYDTDLLSSSMRIFFAKIKKYDFDIIGMYIFMNRSLQAQKLLFKTCSSSFVIKTPKIQYIIISDDGQFHTKLITNSDNVIHYFDKIHRVFTASSDVTDFKKKRLR